jgi:hypothetical protein
MLNSGSGVTECTLVDNQYCYHARQADPSKHGPHHDIFKAELVDILLALQWADNTIAQDVQRSPSPEESPALSRPAPNDNVVIYTDSRASINAISAHLHQRKRVNEKLHAPLLDAICQHLTARAKARRHTWMVKVKSHVENHGERNSRQGSQRIGRQRALA